MIFSNLGTITSFGDSIYAAKINIEKGKRDQSNLLENVIQFNNNFKSKIIEQKNKKLNTFDNVNALYEGWELTLNTFQ